MNLFSFHFISSVAREPYSLTCSFRAYARNVCKRVAIPRFARDELFYYRPTIFIRAQSYSNL